MIKKIAGLTLVTLALSGSMAFASSTGVNDFDVVHPAVVLDGEKVWFPDAQPFLDSSVNRTYVPVRFITEKVGATVTYDDKNQNVNIKMNDKNIVLKIGSKVATVNDSSITLDAPALLVQDRTYVPLHFINDVLKFNTEWNNDSETVIVKTPKYDTNAKYDPFTQRLIRTDNLPKNASDFPFVLKDLPNAAYEYPKDIWYAEMGTHSTDGYLTENQTLSVQSIDWTKYNLDILYKKVKHYYNLILNVDYRTVNDTWAQEVAQYQAYNTGHGGDESGLQLARDYVKYVKAHKIIIQGFAEPEETLIYNYAGYQMQARMVFKVLNYDKSNNGTSIPFIDKYGDCDIFYNSVEFNEAFLKDYYKVGESIDTYAYACTSRRMNSTTSYDYDPSTWFAICGMDNGKADTPFLFSIDVFNRVRGNK